MCDMESRRESTGAPRGAHARFLGKWVCLNGMISQNLQAEGAYERMLSQSNFP
jgi:hypothetical protein